MAGYEQCIKIFLQQGYAETEQRIHDMVLWLFSNYIDIWYLFICDPEFICFKIASLMRIAEAYASLKIK